MVWRLYRAMCRYLHSIYTVSTQPRPAHTDISTHRPGSYSPSAERGGAAAYSDNYHSAVTVLLTTVQWLYQLPQCSDWINSVTTVPPSCHCAGRGCGYNGRRCDKITSYSPPTCDQWKVNLDLQLHHEAHPQPRPLLSLGSPGCLMYMDVSYSQ